MKVDVMRKSIFIMLILSALTCSESYGQNAKEDKSASADTETGEQQKCESIADGNPTIERLARLEGSMSVRNLQYKYFGKLLFNLTPQDFKELKVLKPKCDNSPSEIANIIFEKLEEKIEEAKETRDSTIKWMNMTKIRLQSLSVSPNTIKEIHNTWREMESRSQEMLAEDLKYFANFLNKIRQGLYEKSTAKSSNLITPFHPINNLND